jgi:hypothetical protein
MEVLTGNFNEDIPNAGATTVLVGHPFHLISGRRRSEHEPLRKAPPAQPIARVVEFLYMRDALEDEKKNAKQENRQWRRWSSHFESPTETKRKRSERERKREWVVTVNEVAFISQQKHHNNYYFYVLRVV